MTKKHEHSGGARKAFDNPKEILISAGFENGMSLLDIGSGSGYLSVAAGEIVQDTGAIYALDVYEASINALTQELAEKGITNVKPLLADAVKNIPLPRKSVDMCLMSNVLHGFAANGEVDKVLKNVNEALKDDGKLIIIDFQKKESSFGPPLDIRLSPEEADCIISPYGYNQQKIFAASENHYTLVFKKVTLQDRFC